MAHLEKAQTLKIQEEEKNEQCFLKGEKDQDLGVYCDILSAKSKIEGQDGGVVTSLLLKGFNERLFDAAVVVRQMEGYSAKAVIARNKEDILAARGTIYLKVNVTQKLKELINQGKKRIAIVCTPCEASAVRKIQHTIGNDYEITVIGLFCFRAFNPKRLKEKVKQHLNIDLDKTTKTQVYKGKFTAIFNCREFSCKVKDLDSASEVFCAFCDDFVSRLADVSVGSVGSRENYSTVIVRSPIGGRLLKNHEFTVGRIDTKEIIRLAQFKREHSKKNVSELKKR
ncbi:MAG: hypothetical protein GX799_07560 [Crenarchaeota archaeon]|nr:hypothetical protein [Thermoproteota archaeon]